MKRVEWTQERLNKVNKYLSNSPTSGNDAMLFSFVAADNEIDKDNERFSLKSLKTISSILIGKTGQIGLPNEAKTLARIIESNVRIDPNKRTKSGLVYVYVEAVAYIKKNFATESICNKINNGEIKITEVSLGVSCNKKHQTFDGIVITDVADVYEWSLVPPRTNNIIRFAIKGNDDRYYVAEAPKDITLEQLLKQSDNIVGAYSAMGLGTYEEHFDDERPTDIAFDYDSVVKVSDNDSFNIIED